MNQLLDKFNEYKSIANYSIEYIFENNTVIKIHECVIEECEFRAFHNIYIYFQIFFTIEYDRKNTFVVFWKRSSYFNRIGGQDYVNGN